MGLATISVALIYAFMAGNLATDWTSLVGNPLGLATLVDVYVGFAFFCCWIVWREARLATALLWICMILVAGNLMAALYILVALRTSKGMAEVFWLGSKHAASKSSELT
jgi:hypothetical protein